MKNKIQRRMYLASFSWTTVLALNVISCQQQSLHPLAQAKISSIPMYGTVDAHFCMTTPAAVQAKVKYLFILDKSASNQFGLSLSPNDATGTDPNGARRYGPLNQFINNLVPDPNTLTYFSIIDFNTTAYQIKDPNGVTLKTFTNDTQSFLGTITHDWIGGGTRLAPVPNDSGFTNYVAALSLAETLIVNDAQTEAGNPSNPPVKSTYQIIFVSDGVPTIPGPLGTTVTQTQTDILPLISSILSHQNDVTLTPYINGIVLSTAYYFRALEITAAETLLQKMATAGNGQYLQFGSGQGITYQAFAPVLQSPRAILGDIFVENKNAVWWDDGRLLLDSDGDGLPDEIERKLGSNPLVADSDGNGISDLVEYRMTGQPCADAKCNPALRNNYSICDGLSPVVGNGNTRTFPDSDSDGLNDCEEFLLKSDRFNFSSNNDFIPDFLAFKSNISFLPGIGNTNANSTADGLSNYAKLKLGMPIGIDPPANFVSRTTDLEPEDSTDGSNCYHLVVSKVAVLGPNNTIRMYVEQNTAAVQDSPSMRIAEGQFTGGALTLSLDASSFK
jgi:hypothetical protein